MVFETNSSDQLSIPSTICRSECPQPVSFWLVLQFIDLNPNPQSVKKFHLLNYKGIAIKIVLALPAMPVTFFDIKINIIV